MTSPGGRPPDEPDGPDQPDEIERARRETAGFDVGALPKSAASHDTLFLLGLADRCAYPGGDGFGKEGTPLVARYIVDSLVRDWPLHHSDTRLLSAILLRVGWGVQESDSGIVHEAADLARIAEGLDRYPHALLALRSSALAYSKLDRYVPAWLGFAELRSRLSHYERSYSTGAADTDVIEMYREVQQQALLGETGTAARTVERMLVDWVGGPVVERDGQKSLDEERESMRLSPRWQLLRYNEAFNTLRRGTLTGSLSADEVRNLHSDGPKGVTKASIASWRRRPDVMAARCHLELAVMGRIVENLTAKPAPPPHASWEHFLEHHVSQFEWHYHQAHSDAEIDFDKDHIRELVQLRLHMKLVRPGRPLGPVVRTTSGTLPRCLTVEDPSRDELSGWLRGEGHNANVIVSITSPDYLAWLQIVSGDESTIDWIMDPSQDPIRRDADPRRSDSEHRQLAPALRARYDRAWPLAKQRYEELRSQIAA